MHPVITTSELDTVLYVLVLDMTAPVHNDLNTDVNSITKMYMVKEIEIEKLREKVETLEVKVHANENNIRKLIFKCTLCDFSFKSEKSSN